LIDGGSAEGGFAAERGRSVAKPDLGNKHQCQHCGTRFFDLNKSPITCPKCGAVFHAAASIARAAPRAAAPDDEEAEAGPTADLVSLEDADVGEDKVAEVADDDVEIEVADDTFLEEEEEDTDDGVDLIDVDREDDEER
jgi:uncharacterized protein (TIGR02300 family)